jgi:ubiquinone/menaquinone biosynthesis C-methylase UbiE
MRAAFSSALPHIILRVTIDPNPHPFHEFERSGWERASAHYDDAFGALTRQTADALLDAAAVLAGAEVLDVATGPGPIASAAAARGAHVIGIDFSSAMIAEARRRHHHIEFREGDAEALSFDASTFDAIVMNFGLLHLGRPDTAIAEAYRALKTGGRYALTVWAPPKMRLDSDWSSVPFSNVAIQTSPCPKVRPSSASAVRTNSGPRSSALV